jgi:hypothetical protein
MQKQRAQKVFLCTALMFALIVSAIIGIYGSALTGNENSHETLRQLQQKSNSEKALIILNDALNLNTANYTVKVDSIIEDMYYETLPQELIKLTLETNESQLDVISNFVEDKLRSISLYQLKGESTQTHSQSDPIGLANNFLNKYQTLTATTYLEPLTFMLEDVVPNQNLTTTCNNVKLQVTYTTDRTSIRWTYSINNVEAQMKCVVLMFEKGFLTGFIDNWNLFTVAETSIDVFQDEAIKIAKESTENYSWNVSMGDNNQPVTLTDYKIVDNQTSLTFSNYPSKNDARNGTPLTLYPSWRVKLAFDRIYSGNVYGIDVGIWADTGEVHDVRTLINGIM